MLTQGSWGNCENKSTSVRIFAACIGRMSLAFRARVQHALFALGFVAQAFWAFGTRAHTYHAALEEGSGWTFAAERYDVGASGDAGSTSSYVAGLGSARAATRAAASNRNVTKATGLPLCGYGVAAVPPGLSVDLVPIRLIKITMFSPGPIRAGNVCWHWPNPRRVQRLIRTS